MKKFLIFAGLLCLTALLIAPITIVPSGGGGAPGPGGDSGGTNARQFGTLTLTNLSNNPNVATNISGVGAVTVTSNNLGGWTITGSGDAGGTNARQFGTLTLTNWSDFSTNVVSTTASNAAIALNLWTNSNGTISNVVAGSNFVLRAFGSNLDLFVFDTTVLQTNSFVPILAVENRGTNMIIFNKNGGIGIGRGVTNFLGSQNLDAIRGIFEVRQGDIDGDMENGFITAWISNFAASNYSFCQIIGYDSGSGRETDFDLQSNEDGNIANFAVTVVTNDIRIKCEIGSSTVIDMRPGVGNGPTVYLFDTYYFHTVGNLLELKNFATNKFTVDFAGNSVAAGYALATNGFASYSTLATNAVGATGYTNNQVINQTAYVTATAVAFTLKDRAQATLYVSPVLTATIPVALQPGWSITAASGLVGTVLPF